MRRWWKLHYLTGTFYSTEEAEVDKLRAELNADRQHTLRISYKSSRKMPDDWEPTAENETGDLWW